MIEGSPSVFVPEIKAAELTGLEQAIVLIDEALTNTVGHEVMGAAELTDLLLDVRTLITG